MNTTTRLPLLSVLAASVVLALAGCARGTSEVTEARTEPTAARDEDTREIAANADLMKHLRIGEPQWDVVTGSLKVSGRVEADETRMARISAPVTGRITELEAIEGQDVKRGQALATLYSTELSDAQFALVRGRSQQQLAERSAARAKQLLSADVIAAAEVQRREAELVQANAELTSLRDQLKVLGMSEEAIARLERTRTVNSLTQLTATIDGTVLDRRVTIGQVVQPAETIFTIADLSNVWLVADVPEQIAGAITVGRDVEAEIPALPGQLIRGRLSFVSAIVNAETRTVRVRMDLANSKRWYKPAMLATMVLKEAAERRRVIPSTAVVREQNHEHVFVQIAPSRFALRQVELGDEFGDRRVLIGGIAPGEKIVMDGAFHLNNVRKLAGMQGE
ncbi:MAG: efflux RND transporter periplasmic adaptor subunit [Bryobacteraceae bacterium]